jgi:hypothetical protein
MQGISGPGINPEKQFEVHTMTVSEFDKLKEYMDKRKKEPRTYRILEYGNQAHALTLIAKRLIESGKVTFTQEDLDEAGKGILDEGEQLVADRFRAERVARQLKDSPTFFEFIRCDGKKPADWPDELEYVEEVKGLWREAAKEKMMTVAEMQSEFEEGCKKIVEAGMLEIKEFRIECEARKGDIYDVADRANKKIGWALENLDKRYGLLKDLVDYLDAHNIKESEGVFFIVEEASFKAALNGVDARLTALENQNASNDLEVKASKPLRITRGMPLWVSEDTGCVQDVKSSTPHKQPSPGVDVEESPKGEENDEDPWDEA